MQTYTDKQKRAAAIHDLSGFGKCSLSVALPILSCAGVECACLPTALLSTHTGGFTGYTFRDLTADLLPAARQWHSLGISFDAIYSGYLGSPLQTDIVGEIIELLRGESTRIIVDPVMGDGGSYYAKLTDEHCEGFKKLCSHADIITPNMTEAAFLLGIPYTPPPYTEGYLKDILERLCALGCKNAVVTGAETAEGLTGAACYESAGGDFTLFTSPLVQGSYHGGGDIFTSALTAAICRDIPLRRALAIATSFVGDCIQRTKRRGTDPRFGMDFESALPAFCADIWKKAEEK